VKNVFAYSEHVLFTLAIISEKSHQTQRSLSCGLFFYPWNVLGALLLIFPAHTTLFISLEHTKYTYRAYVEKNKTAKIFLARKSPGIMRTLNCGTANILASVYPTLLPLPLSVSPF
jgi:hypothetical protein